jgi:hypothetical protein
VYFSRFIDATNQIDGTLVVVVAHGWFAFRQFKVRRVLAWIAIVAVIATTTQKSNRQRNQCNDDQNHNAFH